MTNSPIAATQQGATMNRLAKITAVCMAGLAVAVTTTSALGGPSRGQHPGGTRVRPGVPQQSPAQRAAAQRQQQLAAQRQQQLAAQRQQEVAAQRAAAQRQQQLAAQAAAQRQQQLVAQQAAAQRQQQLA